MHPALMVMFLGVALSVASWVWFRLPGQDFWFAAPFWRASKYLRPAGARLWVAGSLITLSGMLWLAWAQWISSP